MGDTTLKALLAFMYSIPFYWAYGDTAASLTSPTDFNYQNSWWAAAIPIFVAIGAALLTNFLTSSREKRAKALEFRRIRIALLHELSSRVAHCVYDYELPWAQYGHKDNAKTRTLKSVIKFKPIDPVIYPTAGAVIGLMKPDSARAIIHFYNALYRWKREIEDASHSIGIDTENSETKTIASSDLRRMSRRLGETLTPALRALTEMKNELGEVADTVILQHFEDYYSYATPQDPRSVRQGHIKPFDLLAEMSTIARTFKEEEFSLG